MLGGEALWERTRELIGAAEGQEEIRWRHRADADELTGRVPLWWSRSQTVHWPFGCECAWVDIA